MFVSEIIVQLNAGSKGLMAFITSFYNIIFPYKQLARDSWGILLARNFKATMNGLSYRMISQFCASRGKHLLTVC